MGTVWRRDIYVYEGWVLDLLPSPFLPLPCMPPCPLPLTLAPFPCPLPSCLPLPSLTPTPLPPCPLAPTLPPPHPLLTLPPYPDLCPSCCLVRLPPFVRPTDLFICTYPYFALYLIPLYCPYPIYLPYSPYLFGPFTAALLDHPTVLDILVVHALPVFVHSMALRSLLLFTFVVIVPAIDSDTFDSATMHTHFVWRAGVTAKERYYLFPVLRSPWVWFSLRWDQRILTYPLFFGRTQHDSCYFVAPTVGSPLPTCNLPACLLVDTPAPVPLLPFASPHCPCSYYPHLTHPSPSTFYSLPMVHFAFGATFFPILLLPLVY